MKNKKLIFITNPLSNNDQNYESISDYKWKNKKVDKGL